MNVSSVEYALDIITGKWKLHILLYLCQEQKIRFNELRRKLPGISNNALSKCLKELEDVNVVQRIQYNEIPPKVEYSLTELGKSLKPTMVSLGEWGEIAQRNAVKRMD